MKKGGYVLPLYFERNDITLMKVDAIVNAANNSLLGGGGVDGCIHRAAGPELLAECMTLHGCETGKAKITKGYRLPAKYVIHTVGPCWMDGKHQERELLTSCYRTSLCLAHEHACESVAFPLISSGIYGYPKEEALQVAVETIEEFLEETDMCVYLIVFDHEAFRLTREKYADVEEFISNSAVEKMKETDSRRRRIYGNRVGNALQMEDRDDSVCSDSVYMESLCLPCKKVEEPDTLAKSENLDDVLKQVKDEFREYLFAKIDESGLTDAKCYTKANVDRRVFSKMKKPGYRPSKETVIAFGFALNMNQSEMTELVERAGYSFRPKNNRFDAIIAYCLSKGIESVLDVNILLYEYNEKQLGSQASA